MCPHQRKSESGAGARWKHLNAHYAFDMEIKLRHRANCLLQHFFFFFPHLTDDPSCDREKFESGSPYLAGSICLVGIVIRTSKNVFFSSLFSLHNILNP